MNEAAPARQSLPNAQRATAFAVTLVVRAVGIEPLFYCDAVKSRFQPLHVAQRRVSAPARQSLPNAQRATAFAVTLFCASGRD